MSSKEKQRKNRKIRDGIIVVLVISILFCWLYSEGQLQYFIQFLSFASLIIIAPVIGVLISISYPQNIPLIHHFIYAIKKRNLVSSAYILKSFAWYGVLSIIILILLSYQIFYIKVFRIENILDRSIFVGYKYSKELIYILMVALVLIIIKWLYFVLKTNKMKEKMINSSPYILKFIPRNLFLPLIVFIIWLLMGEARTSVPTALTSGTWSGVFILISNALLNIVRVFIPNIENINVPVFNFEYLYKALEICLIIFIVFCLSSLMVYLYYVIKSISYKPSSDDIEYKNNIKKLYKKSLSMIPLDFLSKAYYENTIYSIDYEDIKEEEYNNRRMGGISEEINYWKNFTNINIARDTIKWLKKDGIDFCPKFADLLYMVGFSLSILLAKVGIPLIILWLLAGGIALPIYLVVIVSIEHFVFTDVQIWYYTRYFYKHNNIQ